MISRAEIISFCTTMLDTDQFRDVALNGLQVEGTATIDRLATAVSVSEQVIRAAMEWDAGMLVVHHGLFWGDRAGPIAGPMRTRLRLMLEADLNLVAFHLPLDAHPSIGNNALLAARLGLDVKEPFAEAGGQSIGFIASPDLPITLQELSERVFHVTDRAPTILPGGSDAIQRVGIVSGSGCSALEEAANLGCQALVTGDVREPTMALAREMGISVIAGGHEATERLGVQALADLLAREFEIEVRFFGDPNPI